MRNFSKLNTSINSANILEILQRQSWGHTTKNSWVKLPNYLVEIIRYLTFRSSSFMLCQNLIKTLYVLVVVYISWQGIPPKMFTMVNFLMQIMISVWQMLETKSLLWYSILDWFKFSVSWQSDPKIYSRLKYWHKNLIKSYKIDPKIYFSSRKVPSKNGTSHIPIYESYPPNLIPHSHQKLSCLKSGVSTRIHTNCHSYQILHHFKDNLTFWCEYSITQKFWIYQWIKRKNSQWRGNYS